jgi:hypothetical protein
MMMPQDLLATTELQEQMDNYYSKQKTDTIYFILLQKAALLLFSTVPPLC